MKKWIEKYLKRLAESNEKNLGSRKLDCCGLNKQTKTNNSKKK